MLDAAANPQRATRRSSNTAYGKVPLQLPHVSASLRRRGCRSCTARRASSAVAANSPEQDAHVEAVPWAVAQPRAILRPHRASDSERSAVARETDSPPPRDMSRPQPRLECGLERQRARRSRQLTASESRRAASGTSRATRRRSRPGYGTIRQAHEATGRSRCPRARSHAVASSPWGRPDASVPPTRILRRMRTGH